MKSLYILLSNHRTALMGIAVLAVFACHIVVLGELPNTWYKPMFGIPISWGFTQGFLFLSGFGIYHTLEKDDRKGLFYKKRINRLYIPFLVIAGPFIIFLSILHGDSFFITIARLFTLNFLIEGNYSSMWYISVSIFLYSISPIIYYLVSRKHGWYYWVLTFIACVIIIEALQRYIFTPEEYIPYSGIDQIPAYFLGFGVAKCKTHYINSLNFIACLLVITIPFAEIVLNAYHVFVFLLPTFYHLISLLFFAFLFDGMANFNLKSFRYTYDAFLWLGKHSLELYLLHMLIYWSIDALIPQNCFLIYYSIIISLLFCSPIHKFVEKIQKKR